VWTCANQQAAVNATAYKAAKSIYLGEFQTGITYASNTDISYCSGKGQSIFTRLNAPDPFLSLPRGRHPPSLWQLSQRYHALYATASRSERGHGKVDQFRQDWQPERSCLRHLEPCQDRYKPQYAPHRQESSHFGYFRHFVCCPILRVSSVRAGVGSSSAFRRSDVPFVSIFLKSSHLPLSQVVSLGALSVQGRVSFILCSRCQTSSIHSFPLCS
jgi:hypothetical protein